MVSALTLASRILGFARDSAMAAVFGAGEILGAFTLAFRVPNLARSLFGEGALATAFLPIFVAEEQQHGRDAARRLATAVFVRLFAILSVIVAAAEVVLLTIRQTADLTRYSLRLIDLLAIMSPYLLLICLAAMCSAILQAHRRFLWPALVPVLLNAVWLASVAATSVFVTDPEQRIRAIAAMLLVGGALQFCLPAAVLWREGFRPAADFARAAAPARAVFVAMLPTVVATSIAQFNTVLDTLLAWILASPAVRAWSSSGEWVDSGTTAALYFAQRLYQFPLGLIGVAVGTVLFPVLAAHASLRDFGRLRDDLTHALCVAMSVAVPASAGLAVLAGPITAVLFQHGEFDAQAAQLTSRITAVYGSASWAAIGLLIVQRGFFSVGDRQTPLRTGLCATGVNIVLSLIGVWLGGGVGLAAATALTAVFHLALSLVLLRSHVVALDWTTFVPSFVRTLVATTVMACACVLVRVSLEGRVGRLALLGATLAVGIGSFFAAARMVGLSEPWELIRRRSGPSQDAEIPPPAEVAE